jgi:hypothetical protein
MSSALRAINGYASFRVPQWRQAEQRQRAVQQRPLWIRPRQHADAEENGKQVRGGALRRHRDEYLATLRCFAARRRWKNALSCASSLATASWNSASSGVASSAVLTSMQPALLGIRQRAPDDFAKESGNCRARSHRDSNCAMFCRGVRSTQCFDARRNSPRLLPNLLYKLGCVTQVILIRSRVDVRT